GGSPVEIGRRHLLEPPPPIEGLRPAVPAALSAVIRCALEKDPAHRFRRAETMAAALEGVPASAADDRMVVGIPPGWGEVASASESLSCPLPVLPAGEVPCRTRRGFMHACLTRACAGVLCALMLAACGGGETVVAVDAVEPNQGPLGGGQTITVRGEGFLAGGAAPNYALLGGALTLQVSALSDSELQLVTPPGSEPGEVDLVIFNSNGYAVAAGAYAYVGPPEIT